MICKKSINPSEVLVIVNKELGIDITKNTRNRYYIDGRCIYYKILRDELHMSYQSIGATLNKNHATVMHHLKSFDFNLAYDYNLRTLYNNCVDLVANNRKEEVTIESLYARIELLEAKINTWLLRKSKDTKLDTLTTEKHNLGVLKKDILSHSLQNEKATESSLSEMEK